MLTHALMVVLGAAVAGGLLLAFYSPASGSPLPGAGEVPSPGSPAAPLTGGEQGIVAKVRPGLVIINTTLQYDSEAAAGTGMVLNAEGLVLTNNHVIEDSTTISATVVSTGKTYRATVVGYDKNGDVALIQLQGASGLTAVPIASSASVKVGNTVVALGNAEGQGSITATAGQVTELNQNITVSDEGGSTASETLNGMIQTNADIVPGDSGGPLASPAGVIGMDTAGALVGVASFIEEPAGRGFGAFQLNALIRAGSLAAAAVALVFAHGLVLPAASYLLAGLGIGLLTGAGSILYCFGLHYLPVSSIPEQPAVVPLRIAVADCRVGGLSLPWGRGGGCMRMPGQVESARGDADQGRPVT